MRTCAAKAGPATKVVKGATALTAADFKSAVTRTDARATAGRACGERTQDRVTSETDLRTSNCRLAPKQHNRGPWPARREPRWGSDASAAVQAPVLASQAGPEHFQKRPERTAFALARRDTVTGRPRAGRPRTAVADMVYSSAAGREVSGCRVRGSSHRQRDETARLHGASRGFYCEESPMLWASSITHLGGTLKLSTRASATYSTFAELSPASEMRPSLVM